MGIYMSKHREALQAEALQGGRATPGTIEQLDFLRRVRLSSVITDLLFEPLTVEHCRRKHPTFPNPCFEWALPILYALL
jgi:hypothetical protein